MKKKKKSLKQRTFKWLIGIDEVGRGPLAGPVAVCVFAIRFDNTRKNSYIFLKKFIKDSYLRLSDSKKLSVKERKQWFDILKKSSKNNEENILDRLQFEMHYELGYFSARHIDQKGIAVCIKELVKKNLRNLQNKINFKENDVLILLDGSLKAPEQFIHQETIIKGDEKEPVISFASIIAKVERDRLMERMSKKYPKYNFHIHKGYGTLSHRLAIKEHGVCDVHRKTFLAAILNS